MSIVLAVVFQPLTQVSLIEVAILPNSQPFPNLFRGPIISKSMENCFWLFMTQGADIIITNAPFDKALSYSNSIMQTLPHKGFNPRDGVQFPNPHPIKGPNIRFTPPLLKHRRD